MKIIRVIGKFCASISIFDLVLVFLMLSYEGADGGRTVASIVITILGKSSNSLSIFSRFDLEMLYSIEVDHDSKH